MTAPSPLAGGDISASLADGCSARVDLGSQSLILVRHRGSLYCYLNRCPHRGTELDWQPGTFLSADRAHLQCATHGALFDIATGHCVSGPCVGAGLERRELPPGTGN